MSTPDLLARVLAELDGLEDDAAAHIYPDDLEKCSNSECAVTVYSVRYGDISGANTVPLFSREQIIAAIEAAQAQPAEKWEGGEEWERLAWHLCAEEHGEEACNDLLWEGKAIKEPWGDRWMKYEPEAKRMIALVRKFTTSQQQAAQSSPAVELPVVSGFIGVSSEADFEKNTWTFVMEPGYRVTAGRHLITRVAPPAAQGAKP